MAANSPFHQPNSRRYGQSGRGQSCGPCGYCASGRIGSAVASRRVKTTAPKINDQLVAETTHQFYQLLLLLLLLDTRSTELLILVQGKLSLYDVDLRRSVASDNKHHSLKLYFLQKAIIQ